MSAISTAISNFMWRRTAERVETEEPEQDLTDDNITSITDTDEEEGQFVGGIMRNCAANTAIIVTDDNNPQDDDSETRTTGISPPSTTTTDEDASSSSSPSTSNRRTASLATEATSHDDERYRNFTLNDIKRERDKTDAIVMLSSCGWFAAWIVAFMKENPCLILFCLLVTRWYLRFVDSKKEKVVTLNDMIRNWNDDERENNGGLLTTENTIVVNAAQLRRLSMGSQLAIAVVQSQLHALDNNDGYYGYDESNKSKTTKAVADDAKKQWNRFEFHSKKEDLRLNEDEHDDDNEEERECSICLCEYEKGERLISLPCKHVFHEDCITSWTDRHTTCPLCNADLNESVVTTTAAITTTATAITGDELV